MRSAKKSGNQLSIRSGGKNRGFLLFSVLILALQWSVPGQAQQEPPTPNNLFGNATPGERVSEERTRISRRQASELAREAVEGRMLSIRLERGYWRIRMDQEGKVFNVFVDANTGEVTLPAE